MGIMKTPIDSIQYLLDVFIEGGYAEEEDLEHIDAVHSWLKEENQKKAEAFQKRIGTKTQRMSFSTPCASGFGGWSVEPHDWEGDPRDEVKAFPTDYDFEDDEDEELEQGW